MDRSLDETIAERQVGSDLLYFTELAELTLVSELRIVVREGLPLRGVENTITLAMESERSEFPLLFHNTHPPVPPSARDERTNLDNDWVHDRYDDDPDSRGHIDRPRERHDRRGGDRFPEPDKTPPPAKLRVENLHYDLTEDEIYTLFERIAPVLDAKLRYDRAGRSEGVAFVTYQHVADARTAIREFDGANAKGQPIYLTLLPLPRRDNPFDRVENPRSLFDRIEPPNGRGRRRSASPMEEIEDDRAGRRPARRGNPRDRRSDITRPAPENIDRYIPGQRDGRSSSHRGGRRPGERRERGTREIEGHRTANGRPRKTVEELDAEMDDYWGGAGHAQGEAENNVAPAAQGTRPGGGDDVDMIE